MFNVFKLETYNATQAPNGNWYKSKGKDEKNNSIPDYDKPIVTGELIIDQIKEWSTFKDNSLHIQLDPSLNCIAFGDIDHYTDKKQFDKFLDVLADYFEVEKDKISYTLSTKKELNPVEYSYHWSIPSIETDFTTLKKIMADEVFEPFKPDLAVYPTKRKWFRLPYQTCQDKPYKHKIKQGTLKDFFIHYIDNTKERVIIKPDVKPDEKSNDEQMEQAEKELNDKKYLKIQRLLLMLNDNRAKDYEEWRNIGFIIHHELGSKGFELFDEFSKRYPFKYNYNNNNKFYNSIKQDHNDPMTIKTLYKMAKEDNEEEYKKLVKEEIEENKKLSKSKTGINPDLLKLIDCFSHANVAEYYIKYYEEEGDYKYIYNNNLWYSYYNNNILSSQGNTKTPTTLFDNITKSINFELEKLIMKKTLEVLDMQIELGKEKDNTKKEIMKDKIKQKNKEISEIKSLSHTIGTSSFIKGVVDFLQNYYYIDKLQEKINSNINLLAFEDKVFDYTIKDFRPIKKSDFITFTTRYKAPTISKPEIKEELNKLLLEVFNNYEIVKYWLQTISMSIFTTKYESVYIHTGSGGNSKGLLFSLISYVMGDYYKQTDNEFLTTKFKSDAPNSQLANSKGVRFLVLSEPAAGDGNAKQSESKLNVDFVKFLSGNDKIACRDLYEKSLKEFVAQFTLFIQCNMKPKLSKSDKGIFRRLKIIDYPNEFVENPDPKKPNQKKIDVNLKTKLSHQDYINEFMLMLLETAKEGKIDEPQQIKDAVNEYKEDNDPIKGWLLENFELLREDLPLKERIKTSELYNEFPEKLNLTASSFKQYLIMNEVKVKICSGINYAFNLKRKPQQEEQNDLDN